MDSYGYVLFGSDLPLPPWAAALAWATLFLVNRRIIQLLRAANDAQKFLVVEDWSVLRRALGARHVFGQMFFAGIVFLLAMLLGRPAFVFFVGGFLVAMTCILALNVQGLFSARDIARPNAVTGALTFSTAAALRHSTHRLACAALSCLLLGLIVAHLALLGGAFFLGASAAGSMRKARNALARPG